LTTVFYTPVSVYDSTNSLAKEGFDAAVKYLNANPKEGVKVNQHYTYSIDKSKIHIILRTTVVHVII